MREDIQDILFSEDVIKARVRELGTQITQDYFGRTPALVGILKGSFIFLADLVRSIGLCCEIKFLSASSYGFSTVTTGKVKIGTQLDSEFSDKHVILIEDILDSGVTMAELQRFVSGYGPASLRVCTLLDKPERRQTAISADYIGFECPDEFLVGYGLDYAERYRNLPFIASLKPEIYL